MTKCRPSKSPTPKAVTIGVGTARLYEGDCIDIMSKLPAKYDMAFADPPFNIGHEYNGDGKADRRTDEDYRRFTATWLTRMAARVRPGGAIFVHVPDHIVAYCYEVLYAALRVPCRNWIILHQEFGQYGESKFITSKVHCLYFVKPGGKPCWNVEEVLEPSQRLTSGDPRAASAKYKGMRPMLDVWYGENLGRVQGNNEERWNPGRHPNQLPEMYMARLIRCATKPGGRILDPFCGSGTTAVVAFALGRTCDTIEIDPDIAQSALSRITRGAMRDVAGSLIVQKTVIDTVS